jgi:uncharacterized protein (TIGR03435 family)
VSVVCAFVGVASAQAPAFEVASVKPNKSGDVGAMISGPRPGSFITRNAPLDRIIIYAFGVKDYQLDGVPAWARDDRFDIVGKYPEGPTPPPQQVALMVQALLAERFKLQTHAETRQGPAYALMLARRDGRLGPRLKPTTVDCAAYITERRAAGQVVSANGVGDAALCTGVMSNRFIKMSVRPISILASALANQVGRPVIDQTGLTGSFEYNLEWSPGPFTATPAADGVASSAQPDDSVSLFTALEEQLGLKLESTTAPSDALVIDHIEQPTPD